MLNKRETSRTNSVSLFHMKKKLVMSTQLRKALVKSSSGIEEGFMVSNDDLKGFKQFTNVPSKCSSSGMMQSPGNQMP